jgi:hypothetical protein
VFQKETKSAFFVAFSTFTFTFFNVDDIDMIYSMFCSLCNVRLEKFACVAFLIINTFLTIEVNCSDWDKIHIGARPYQFSEEYAETKLFSHILCEDLQKINMWT